MTKKLQAQAYRGDRSLNGSPSQIIEKVCGLACLRDLPWLDMSLRSGEREYFEAWEKRQTAPTSRQLHIEERKSFTARGPQGFWAIQENKFGRWWRPHKLDELFVEVMYPIWNVNVDQAPSYLIVIGSGPIGARAIYQNDRFQYLVIEENEAWLADLSTRSIAVGRESIGRYSFSPPTRLGKS